MGKATELDEQLQNRRLSPAEIAEREAAAASGSLSESTNNGQLIPRGSASKPDRVIVQAPAQTWD
ncbi:MAG TPA: hypothetical protein VIH71_15775 [Solirubrobacteraceae bacterium]